VGRTTKAEELVLCFQLAGLLVGAVKGHDKVALCLCVRGSVGVEWWMSVL